MVDLFLINCKQISPLNTTLDPSCTIFTRQQTETITRCQGKITPTQMVLITPNENLCYFAIPLAEPNGSASSIF